MFFLYEPVLPEPPKAPKFSVIILSEFSNIIQQRPNEHTVVSLQRTIQDLQIQKQELNTTITVPKTLARKALCF